jgi:hypothetical protein
MSSTILDFDELNKKKIDMIENLRTEIFKNEIELKAKFNDIMNKKIIFIKRKFEFEIKHNQKTYINTV